MPDSIISAMIKPIGLCKTSQPPAGTSQEAHRRQYSTQPPLMAVDYLFPGTAEGFPRGLR